MLTTADLAKIVLGSGLTATLVTFIRDWLTDRGATRRNRAHTSLRLAVHLERYAHQCASVSAENGDYVQTQGQIGRGNAALPLFSPFPEVDWKCLPAQLASDAMSFENQMLIAQDSVRAAAETEQGLDYGYIADSSALIGQQAWEISCELRKYGGLPSLPFEQPNWHFAEYLQTEGPKVRERRIFWSKRAASWPPKETTDQ